MWSKLLSTHVGYVWFLFFSWAESNQSSCLLNRWPPKQKRRTCRHCTTPSNLGGGAPDSNKTCTSMRLLQVCWKDLQKWPSLTHSLNVVGSSTTQEAWKATLLWWRTWCDQTSSLLPVKQRKRASDKYSTKSWTVMKIWLRHCTRRLVEITGVTWCHYLYLFSAPNIQIHIYIGTLTQSGCGLNWCNSWDLSRTLILLTLLLILFVLYTKY